MPTVQASLGQGPAEARICLNVNDKAKELDSPSGWPAPDPAALQGFRRPPPALPLEQFGPWAAWLGAAAEGAGAPVDYVAGPLLAATAALIGTTRAASPWPGWVEPSVLWIGLVGDPSSGKSPGADPVLAPLADLEQELGIAFAERHRAWRRVRRDARFARTLWERRLLAATPADPTLPPAPAPSPPEPLRPRLTINDVSLEALAAILAANPRGVLHHRDELAGLLGRLDRYGGDRALWLEAHGARPYTLDRVRHGDRVHIARLAVSLLGGLQPERLARLLRGDDDGLAARFLWLWPEALPPLLPGRATESGFIARAFRRLLELRAGADESPRVLPLDDAASRRFQEWRQAHHGDAADGRLASTFGKLPGAVLRLALVLEHARWATGDAAAPAAIGLDALAAAAALVDGYFKPMARRVYGDAALRPAERDAATLAQWLRRERLSYINARGVRLAARLPGLRDAAAMNDALIVLIKAGWLRPMQARNGEWPGRYRKDYAVNPAIKRGEV